MKLATHPRGPGRVHRRTPAIGVAVLLLSTGLVLPLTGAQAATTVPLGTAENFAVLAGSTITNTGATTVTGDIGLHPGSSVTGFGPGADAVTQTGALYETDGVALQAKSDLDTAYTNAAGQTPVTEVPTELGGTTLKAGVYDSDAGTFGVTGTLTLDGENNPDGVFIFQMGSTLTTASASSVSLINGANPCNVFWQVGSSATLGTGSSFVGTIMADQSISLETGAKLQGRVLARVAAVTMDNNTITTAPCATPTGGEDTDETGTTDETDTTDETETTDGTDTTGGAARTAGPADGDDSEDGGDDNEDGDDVTGGSATPPGDTTSQIQQVPGGGVATGGGGVDPATPGSPLLLAALLVFLTVGATVGVVGRRRLEG